MQITPYFTLEEFIFSETAIRLGIDNSLPKHYWGNLVRTAEGMERCRALLGHPIIVSSGFRCFQLNQVFGSKPDSQHTNGEAVDFICPAYGSPFTVAKLLKQNEKVIKYDQLIYEYRSWVHISFSPAPRGMALTIFKKSDGYFSGIVS